MANTNYEFIYTVEDYSAASTSVVPPAGQARWFDNYDSSDADRVVHVVGDGTTTLANLEKYNSRDDLLELVYPVGCTYTQYPNASTPATLGFPGTWTAQFETEGIAFRTPGGNASAFEAGIQEDAFQGHAHQTTLGQRYGSGQGSGGPYYSRHDTVASVANGTSTTNAAPVSDGSSGTPRTANENRMRNRTFRVWRRTA